MSLQGGIHGNEMNKIPEVPRLKWQLDETVAAVGMGYEGSPFTT